MLISFSSGILAFTTMLMLTSLKLISFAYNYFDGTYDRKRVFGEHSDPKAAKMYADRKRFAITSLPNPLEFYGYVYCFTCLLAGPAFEYSDYASAIDETNETFRLFPSRNGIAIRKFLVGLFCLGIHMALAIHFKTTMFYTQVFVKKHNILSRVIYTYLAIVAQRFRFYFAWKIAEGSCVMGGFGLKKTAADQGTWEEVEIVDIIGVETAVSLQMLTRHWNKRTQGWLERYVYCRTNRSLVATYFVSAIWHGPYPGFLMFFSTVPLLTMVERLIRCKINPLILQSSRLDSLPENLRRSSTVVNTSILLGYWAMCWLCLTMEMVYLSLLFTKQPFYDCITAIASYYYIGHFTPLVLYGLLILLPSPDKELKVL